ncbi:hypothetical protein C1M55_11590 [Rhodococcus qingshengii]|nr:hypothetical protein C1M55_11590 [Rhodococcus qingshengii]OMQ36729.1 hypothetical protein BK799_09035 [Rhodococcus sp. D-1]
MRIDAVLVSEALKALVAVDVPDGARSCRGAAFSRSESSQLYELRGRMQVRERNRESEHTVLRERTQLAKFEISPVQRAQIGRNVMTVLAFRSRGRHRTGVPALELIASARAVNAPVCGNCTSINLSAHTDPGFGDYFVCEDCMTQLDTDGSRI